MKLKLIFTMVVAWLIMGASPNANAQQFNPDVWVEDFSQLKQEMSAHYSNLEWAIENRKLDLKQLSETVVTRLRGARNDAEAKRVIEAFLDAFGDGHLFVQWPKAEVNTPADTGTKQPPVAVPLCEQLNYSKNNQAPRIDYTLLSNYNEIKNGDSKYFTIGVLRLPSKKDIGIIRIPIFSEYAFPDLCEIVTAEMQLAKDSGCNEDCEDRIERKVANLLTAALARQVEALKQAKISVLLVDITGNGGGTNWTEPAARTLTAKLLRSPLQQFIRHPHWTKQFQKRLDIIEADTAKLTPEFQRSLNNAQNILKTALLESQKNCDRSVLWENRKPDCSLIAQTPTLYPQSVQPFARPGALPDKASGRLIFYPSRYAYKEGVYSGQMVILTDRYTWSSAEYFTAMLRDNNAAIIMGEPTGGAGCGYTNGGIRTVLKNTKAVVKIPDCVRLRADGTNEVAGITPDVLIPWRANDNRYQKAKRVLDALAQYTAPKTNK